MLGCAERKLCGGIDGVAVGCLLRKVGMRLVLVVGFTMRALTTLELAILILLPLIEGNLRTCAIRGWKSWKRLEETGIPTRLSGLKGCRCKRSKEASQDVLTGRRIIPRTDVPKAR